MSKIEDISGRKLSIELINELNRDCIHLFSEDRKDIYDQLINRLSREFPNFSNEIIEAICSAYKKANGNTINDIIVIDNLVFIEYKNNLGEIVNRNLIAPKKEKKFIEISESDIPCTLYMATRVGAFEIGKQIILDFAKKIADISEMKLLMNLEDKDEYTNKININCEIFNIIEAYNEKEPFAFKIAFYNPKINKYMIFDINNSYEENIYLEFSKCTDTNFSLSEHFNTKEKQLVKSFSNNL